MSITQDILNKRNESRKQAVEKTPTKKRPRKAKSKDIVPMSNVLDETVKGYTNSSKGFDKELFYQKLKDLKTISTEELFKLYEADSIFSIGADITFSDYIVFTRSHEYFRISKETAEEYSKWQFAVPEKYTMLSFNKEEAPKDELFYFSAREAIKSVTPIGNDILVVFNEGHDKESKELFGAVVNRKSEEMKKSVVSKKFSRETSEDDSLETKTTQSNPSKSNTPQKDSVHSTLTRQLLTTQAVSAYPIEVQALKESIERYNINSIYSNYYIDPDTHVLLRKRDFINIKDLEGKEKTPAYLRVEKIILDRNEKYPINEGTKYPMEEGTKYPIHENTKYPIGDLDKDVIDSELSRKIDMLFDGLYREIRSVRSKAMELIRESLKSRVVPDMMDKTKHPKKKLLIVDRLAIVPEKSTSKSDKSHVEANEPEKPKRFLKSANRRAKVGTLLLCKCGKEFVKKNSKQIYCCTECSVDEIIKKGK